MTEEGDEESIEAPLVEQRLAREGLTLKLDRGFEEGTYCVYVHFPELTSRIGYAAARRRAGDYCAVLRGQLDRLAGHSLGETEDATSGARKRQAEELHYLTFPVVVADERFPDEAMKKQFQLAVLRTGQQWEQDQTRVDTQRLAARRDAFRRRLGGLLDGQPYHHLDGATKERLLEDVPSLAFPPKGVEL